MHAPFILASSSPRRQELLKKIGLDFKVIPSDIDEKPIEGESPLDHAIRLSREKTLAVSLENPGAWVLGADTIVVIDEEILGKPRTPEEAKAMLLRLSGRRHKVITGFSIAKGRAESIVSGSVESFVVFRKVAEDEANWYVKSREPYDKSGGYAVQGKSALFIREVHGSYTNVIGLPVCEVVEALKDAGFAIF
jgi:septum formation protein